MLYRLAIYRHSRRFIFLSDRPTFDKNPTLYINLPQYNASIDMLTLSHWVDIQYFEQNKLNECLNLNEWIKLKSPTHILLDICPNRLNYIYEYNINNHKPNENEIIDDEETIDAKQTNKMNRFTEKIERLDEIYKLKLVTSANKVKQNKILQDYKLTEPIFTDIDIWYFEFYWNLFQTYFKDSIPHFNEFKKEFYLNSNKFRFLNIIYGDEIFIALNSIFNQNLTFEQYSLPKLKNIHSTNNEFDQTMNKFETENETLLTSMDGLLNDNNCKLITGGMPIEFINRKIQKLKKPMLWIEFAMSIKNYFADQHAQNLANQVPLICDLQEFIYTPYARKIKYNSWDSTIELNQMISCVIPQFYDIFIAQQSKYLFNNLLKLLHEQHPQNEKKRIIIFTGQGVAQLLNQHVFDLLSNDKKKTHLNK